MDQEQLRERMQERASQQASRPESRSESRPAQAVAPQKFGKTSANRIQIGVIATLIIAGLYLTVFSANGNVPNASKGVADGQQACVIDGVQYMPEYCAQGAQTAGLNRTESVTTQGAQAAPAQAVACTINGVPHGADECAAYAAQNGIVVAVPTSPVAWSSGQTVTCTMLDEKVIDLTKCVK